MLARPRNSPDGIVNNDVATLGRERKADPKQGDVPTNGVSTPTASGSTTASDRRCPVSMGNFPAVNTLR